MKKYIFIFTLLSLACMGEIVTTTPRPIAPANTKSHINTAVQIPTLTPYSVNVNQVVTLDELNVRACPRTTCSIVGGYMIGAKVEVGVLITNNDEICQNWYSINWRGRGAWICADWTIK